MSLNRIIITFIASVSFMTAEAQTLPYQNTNLSAEERAADLCNRLTLEEKTQLMINTSPAIPRLGIPQFAWWSEGLHGAGRNGFATVFPSCIGMAASFDDALLFNIFTAVSDEIRAKNTLLRKTKNEETYQGLSVWTPNINIFRDPRWGRGQETYGEDPYLTSKMGCAVVRGLQGPENSKYRKLYACAKHFAVHSGPEKTRHHFDIENLSARDLHETYLPAFKSLVQDADVKEIMCAYQSFEGEPCCGSNKLLQQILRNDWDFKGLVVSDCGAISDFWKPGCHEIEPDKQHASAKAVISGTDVECGSNYTSLPEAVKEGIISEQQIDISVKRLLKARFELGDMTPDTLVPWKKIGPEVIACKKHKELALQMAHEQTVLLQNRNNLLPLKKDASKIMVIGPNAIDSTMLWGIYTGQPTSTVTILDGIKQVLGSDVRYTQGCDITALTENDDLFNSLSSDGKLGMKGTFWNNTKMEGAPVSENIYTNKLNFDNGGNTVFAPGVNLNNFSAKFTGSFIADANGTLTLRLWADDGSRIIINGDTIYKKWGKDRLRQRDCNISVEKGKQYDVELDYMQLEDAATLRFDLVKTRKVTPKEIVAKAKDAETIIFVGGISPALEREEAKVVEPGFDGGDRTSIELPSAQREILNALSDAGKNIVFVNCSGSAVALTPETTSCDAIIQAWYAGELGGRAIADIIFGDYNPSGKLPITFYKNDSQLKPFNDYNMSNRTYRFFHGEPLYSFGYGLSYTDFSYGKAFIDKKKLSEGETLSVSVPVSNIGHRDGTEITQLYLHRPNDNGGPIKTLRGFRRTEIKAGETVNVSIEIPYKDFEWWDASTNTMRPIKGKYDILIGKDSRDTSLQKLSITIK